MTGYANNYNGSIAFRALLVLLMRVSGISAQAKPVYTKLSEAVAQDRPNGDILGIKNWSILTRKEVKIDLSGGSDRAARVAELDGNKKSALVWYRRGHEASKAYVIMSFDTFLQVLQEEQEREDRS
ncbi:hypothetical protein [Cryobacterium arcticum]|uniref:Uncharacterized protein n=1 Tax=Cryobacterium arcticum TaxID=670052 RepID=A0A317ZLU9_9MICO|nr:hypothetical protein [Cryobacterium arcticum]PXA67480.1 hypothetical protein CTB96_12200 [Cryobacterium arcticum]